MVLLTQTHQQFIDHLKQERRSTNTILAYGKDIAQFLAHLKKANKTTPKEITTADISQFQSSFSAYAPKSISRKLNSVKTFCRFLKLNGALPNNPALKIHSPSLTTTPPRILTQLEYRALREDRKSVV